MPFSGTHVQFFVEACDTAGNCGFSSNKGRYFDAQPLPAQGTGTITLTPDRGPDTRRALVHELAHGHGRDERDRHGDRLGRRRAVPACDRAGDAGRRRRARRRRPLLGRLGGDRRLPDRRPRPAGHSRPSARTRPTGRTAGTRRLLLVTFTCTDDLSGVAPGACLIDGGTSNHVTLGQSASPQSVSASATDNAGNTRQRLDLGAEGRPHRPGCPDLHTASRTGSTTRSQTCRRPRRSAARRAMRSPASPAAWSAATAPRPEPTSSPRRRPTRRAARRPRRSRYTVVASSLDGKILISRLFRIWLLDPSTGAATRLAGSSGPLRRPAGTLAGRPEGDLRAPHDARSAPPSSG